MISLKDKLSHLNYTQACKLLGSEGKKLIMAGGKYDINVFDQVILKKDSFTVNFENAVVSMSLNSGKSQKLNIECSACRGYCEHEGAALSLLLEEKMALGLSAPPPERVPVESLSDTELIEQEIQDRIERAQKEKIILKSMNPKELWTDYIITNKTSGKSYRVALRGWERGESFCSCPDFRKNTLGTCKHIIYAISRVKNKFSKSVLNQPVVVNDIHVFIKYGKQMELRLQAKDNLDPLAEELIQPFRNSTITHVKRLIDHIQLLENAGYDVIIYPDAEEYISKILYQDRVKEKVKQIRQDPANHPLRHTLLKAALLPYQLDGIAFAVGAGRAVLADDMGLGKTIQGIGVAELLSQDALISKVLVVCPTSLKSQWEIEIKRFSSKSCQIVYGSARERPEQYDSGHFFTICNYEQVLRDILSIEKLNWDLIILDEGQRIKNWEAKTSQTIKALKSPFALVLSGTPLENRIDELFSVVEFIDDRRLGPAFRFFNRYRIVDEKGKLLGYKNLDKLKEKLKPVLLRRTRKKVIKELPPRTTEIRRIAPTEEQIELHNSYKKIISSIINKKYLTEMDILRLQKALLMCRMCADSTFLIEKTGTGYSSKLKEIEVLLEQLMQEEDRKVILFSEWTTMLDLIEPLIEKLNIQFVRLDGSVPQKKRQHLIQQFQSDPDCRLFIATNAGSTGLNLQAANTVINVDLPWNPAILEQRIGRAHRMGQKNPVQVFLLVTENTLEENLLATLSAKHELSLAVLDPDVKISEIDLSSGMEALKRRMEMLLGNKPDAPEDESMMIKTESEASALLKKEKVSTAGAHLMNACFSFIGEILSDGQKSEADSELTSLVREKLTEYVEKDDQGNLKITFTLPNASMIDNMASSFAKIISAAKVSA